MTFPSSILKVAVLALSVSPLVAGIRHYNIVNNCPLAITLYINGASQGTLGSYGGSTSRHYPEGWSGFIYTDFNQGNQDGAGTIRAGFYGTGNYYYVVKDTNWLNVGVSINPIDRAPVGGFCLPTACEVDDCPNAYTQPPTAFPPNQGGVPPSIPLYECPVSDTGYTVTFCPSGDLPNYQTGPRTIQPVKSNAKCLEVRGGLANGAAVQINDCNSPNVGANKWVIKRGNQQIKVSGTGYCLDAGSSPASGVGAKIWQCYDNLPAQQWTYTPDNYIRLTNTNQCLDLTDGDLSNGRQAQTWECAGGNQNQLWTT